MIILTDCLADRVDEGGIKVANNLIRKLKDKIPDIKIFSYKNKTSLSDLHLTLNGLFLNKELYKSIENQNSILYIPFASNSFATIIRTYILSMLSKKKVFVLFLLRHPMNDMAKLILKISHANIIVLSKDSYNYFKESVNNNIFYLKTGVDINKFIPIDKDKKMSLRTKHNISLEKKVVLHVGHLKYGRNIDKLISIDEKYQVIVVVSTKTQSEADLTLRRRLEEKKNITIIDKYIPNIEEIYQVADVYVFPVDSLENCIDVPVSVLEAASCNIPVVSTEYGELKTFCGKEGFIFIKSFSELNNLIEKACNMSVCHNRKNIEEYDWEYSIMQLIDILSN